MTDAPATTEQPAAPGGQEQATRFGLPASDSRGQVCLHAPREGLAELIASLRDDQGFTVCLDVTAVDYLTYEAPRDLPEGVKAERFEVVILLLSMRDHERLRVRVQVPSEDPTMPSLFDLHPGTEAMEREVFDLFGIRFSGHPDLSRILMPEDWIGHPLRKDYAIGRIPVQFKSVEDAS